MSRLLALMWAGAVLGAAAGAAQAAFHHTPEIDPGMAAGALTLLTGGVLILTAMARRR